MAVYYNEFDPLSAEAIRELIREGLLPYGKVDERSIRDVAPNDLKDFEHCHFFAGIGIWAHVTSQFEVFDDKRLWTGSCPCQPFSTAGKGRGFADERHLWPDWHWLIEQSRPSILLGEQVSGGSGLDWFDLVRSDLETSSYSVAAVITSSAGTGTIHNRERLYWTALARDFTDSQRNEQSRREPRSGAIRRVERSEEPFQRDADWPRSLSFFRGMDDGDTRCVGLTDAIRNALCVPQAEAFVVAVIEALK